MYILQCTLYSAYTTLIKNIKVMAMRPYYLYKTCVHHCGAVVINDHIQPVTDNLR